MRTKAGEPRSFFLEHLKDETDACVVWPFARDKWGYGIVPRNRRAHIMACILTHGPRPPGMEVSHSCDNPSCFNPRHLSWKTRQQNEDEKTARGRRPYKLTAEQKAAIQADPRSTRKIASEYEIHWVTVSKIKRGLSR